MLNKQRESIQEVLSMKLDEIAKAYKALHEAANSTVLYEELLTEDRIDFLKNKWPEIQSGHDTGAVHRKAADIIDFLANKADPTKKKNYTQWIVNRYNSGAFRQEDAPRIHQTLSDFDAAKHHLPVEQRDIGKYSRLSDIALSVAPFAGKDKEQVMADKMAKQSEEQHPGFDKKYEDENITVHHLHNNETSQKLFGRPRTEWCTAWEGNSCRFDHYTKEYENHGPLFVVTRKKDGAVFQYHPTSNQFMDKNDDPINQSDLKTVLPSLHKAWKQDPSLLGHSEA